MTRIMSCLTIVVSSMTVLLTSPATATTVRFDTVLGDILIDLYDVATPITVSNFLDYVTNGSYDNSIVHRSVPGFVIQGGGFYTNGNPIPSNAPIVSEAGLSNVRGTIAMARLPGDPDSATSQWFINLVDNTFLDSGYTVFGEVRPADMAVVDAIAALPTVNAGGDFTNLPVFDVGEPLVPSNLVVLNEASVVPEPASITMLLLGSIGLACRILQRRKPG